MSTTIQRINKNMPNVLNKDNEDYKKLFGKDPYTPITPISVSSDVDCGAVSNEIEFLRQQINELIESFSSANAESDVLDELVELFSNIKRIYDEEDSSVRNRIISYLVREGNPRWHTKWAYIDVFTYFFPSAIILCEEDYIETNSILNSSFEDSAFLDWTKSEAGASVITQENIPFEGARSAKYAIDSSNSAAYLHQTISGVTAGNYKICLWYKDDDLCPTANVLKVYIKRSGDSYYYNFTTGLFQAGASYLEAPKVGDVWTYLSSLVVNADTRDLTIYTENSGGAGTAYNFYIDRVRFGERPDYASFDILVIFNLAGFGSMLFLVDDTVVDWDPSNLYLDQGFFGGSGGNFGTDYYNSLLEKIRSAGIKGLIEFLARE